MTLHTPSTPTSARRRHIVVWALNALALVGATSFVATDADACFGTPRPPVCSRSSRLVKASPAVVILPPSPVAITVPVPVNVFLSSSGSCPPALATTFALTATCTPPGAGTLTIPTPSGNGTFPAFVPVTFPPGPARTCTVTGTATTTWADGVVTVATGDTVICLVDPAPGDPSKPRLSMDLLTPEIQTAHAGDQVIDRYRLTNNDPTEAVTVEVAVDSEQTAKVPTATGLVPGSGSGVYAIADPGGGDNFPIAFLEDLVPDPPPGNNYLHDDGTEDLAIGQDIENGFVWLNAFDVQSGAQVIDKVSVAFGADADGKRYSVLLYEDPNDDGDPSDAVLLTRTDAIAANGGSDTYNEVKIVPQFVGSTGEKFFVGIVMQELEANDFVAAFDTNSDAGKSWVAGAQSSCAVNVNDLSANDIPVQPISNFDFNGNWMVRARGGVPTVQPWVNLPADPPGTPIPTITRTLRLCPGESRDVQVASRSWPGCPSGSGCEKRIVITGTFDDGSPALACGGTAHAVDNVSVPPNYDCPDGGTSLFVQPKANGTILNGVMPTHDVAQCALIEAIELFSEGAQGPLLIEPRPTEVLSEEQARMALTAFDPNGGPAAQIGQPFGANMILRIDSMIPEFQTELQELMLVGASPVVGDTYFSFKTRSAGHGPSIPPTLETFVEGMFQLSVDGEAFGQHFPAQIDQGSIFVEILDEVHLAVNFQGVFLDGPPQIEALNVLVDVGGAAIGLEILPPALPCVGDIDGDGAIGFGDLLDVLSNWGPCPGCAADFNGDNVVDFADLLHLLSNWGPCP